jgi:dCMP deaminase
VNNNDDFPASNVRQKKKFIDRIYNDYISLIKNKKDNLITPDRLPTVNETLMTIAYAESQRSSCLKRKVGCVIASISTVNGDENSVKDSVQIISSGHNEVPTGTTPCIFTEFEKCYRDHLQEKQAEKIKYCPKCGEKIKLSFTKCKCGKKTKKFLRVCPSCKKPVDISYECPKCNTDVFSEYLHSGGKLLDMCRALHAEENALLNLTKIGSLNLENSVLYTTTYPCNLCANKIGTAGIKKVIYADPYTMEDAKDILENSGVQTEKFQGIKSSAFFRLYK